MKNLNFLSLFLLVFVVFLSGCVRQDRSNQVSNGVIIKGFYPEFSEVYTGEPVTIYLEIQNVGDADAKNVEANLISLNPAEWGLSSFPPLRIGTLPGSDSLDNLSGGEWEGQWDLTAPSTINTRWHEFVADVRVYYDYKTNATGAFRFLTNDYLKSLKPREQEAIKESSALVSSKSSNAPIQVSFSTTTRPFIVYTDGQEFQFEIKITNVGQGNPIYDGRMYYMKINKPDIKGDVDIDCPSIGQDLTIKLQKGESKTISCSAIVHNKADINQQMIGNVHVNLNYRYFVDASTKITVIQQA